MIDLRTDEHLNCRSECGSSQEAFVGKKVPSAVLTLPDISDVRAVLIRTMAGTQVLAVKCGDH